MRNFCGGNAPAIRPPAGMGGQPHAPSVEATTCMPVGRRHECIRAMADGAIDYARNPYADYHLPRLNSF